MFSLTKTHSTSKEPQPSDHILQKPIPARLLTPKPVATDAHTKIHPKVPLDTDAVNKVEGVIPQPEKRMRSDSTMFVKGFRLSTIANLSGRIVEGTIPRESLEMGGWT